MDLRWVSISDLTVFVHRFSTLVYSQIFIEHGQHGCCRFSQVKTKIRANPLYLRHQCSIEASNELFRLNLSWTVSLAFVAANH
jgi:hypothetical protein